MDPRAWLPLTAAQRGLFFAQQLDPDNPSCTTAEVVELDGPVDADRLREAHRRTYAEHEQLRVVFGLDAQGPRQRVLAPRAAELGVVEVADEVAAQAWVRSDVARPMRLLGERAEVVRAALLRLPDGRCWWYHAAHHVVADGYGAQQLLRRIAEHHDALVGGTAAPHVQVPPLAAVVAEDAARDDTAAKAAWGARLDDVRGVVGLAGRIATAGPSALRAGTDLDAVAQAAVVDGARRLGVGWTDLVTAAVGAYLARFAGLPATRLGLPLMNRVVPGVGRLAAAGTVCTAMNVLPLEVPGRGTVADAVAAVAAGQRLLREHPFVRQEDLQRTLTRRHPGAQLFGAQLNLIPFGLELSLAGPAGPVRGVVRNVTAGPVEDLTIGLRGTPGRGRVVRLEIDAHPDLYDAAGLAAHLERLTGWIAGFAAADAAADVAALPLVTPAEQARIDGFNATTVPHAARTLGRRFADQAARTPDATALVMGEESRTYGQLLVAARRIAAGLRERGVGAGDVVGVALERGFGLYETVHAIALLGAVYLPVDPDLPPARRAMMLADAAARIVVEDPGEVQGDPGALPEPPEDPAAPAYLIFTSGSTGRPKGVVVGGAAIDNRLAWMQRLFALRPGERVLHKTPISFDVSVWELYWPLQVGASVVIAEPGAHRDPRRLADLVVDHEVGTLHFVPSMLRAFLADRRSRERMRESRVRSLICSGEALTPDLVAAAAAVLGVAPVNLYGPTEAAVDVTWWPCDADDTGPVPIGRPVANTTCHVLDAGRRPLPIGAVGELWLGGVQLADGYVARPDLSAERFVEVALPEGRRRLYRTGDLAAWRPDGALRYLGRTDDQVKVRGQRVELGEVEAAVAGAPGVAAVAAGVVEDRLVLWFVPVAGTVADDTREALREMVREHATRVLPAGWLPSRFVAVEAMPLGTSGKTDRARLAAMTEPDEDRGTGAAPISLVEQRLCALLGEVLGRGPLAPDADFFAHGGDSLAVLRLLGRVEEDLGVDLGLADVFAAPTPAGLAACVASGSAGAAGAAGLDEVLTLRAARGAERAPLFLLPPAGGLGWCYTGLLAALPPDQPVHALQAPGIATGTPATFTDLAAMARRQLAAIRSVVGDGRFHVAGWSLGGMAAHTLAALARDDGPAGQVGAVVLLDAYPSDQWQHLAVPDEEEALRGILRMGGVEGLLDQGGAPLDRARVAEVLRAGGSALAALPPAVLAGCIASVVGAARVVRTSAHPVLDGDVDVVVATAPRAETWLDATGWASYTKGEVRTHPVAAAHGDLVRRPVADEVGAVLAAVLRREEGR